MLIYLDLCLYTDINISLLIEWVTYCMLGYIRLDWVRFWLIQYTILGWTMGKFRAQGVHQTGQQSTTRATTWRRIIVFQCFVFSKCISSARCKSWCLTFKWMRIHHWGWEPLWLFALAVQWINVVGGLCACRWNSQWNSAQQGGMTAQQVQGAGVTTLFLLQPTPLQWSYAVEEWGEIPGVNPTYFHTLWTLCGHRPRFWARGQGPGLQPNCFHSFLTNLSGPPSHKYTHKPVFWILNSSLVS